ncbi:MAG TPA: ABC transporter permease, partial [Solirubrobacter sp.]
MTDQVTFIQRSLRHSVRSIDALLTAIMLPVAIMLMFVYVFGGAIDTGGRYVDYVVPGIIVLCAGFGSAGTAVAVALDMTTGVVDRFRTLPISAAAVLTGHVTASVIRNVASTLLVLGVALIAGFRPVADPLNWLAAAGLLLALMTAISWLAACFGLIARSVEAANAITFVAAFAPYLSSAFVPADTMPAGLQWIAEHQPVTPI